MKPSTRKLWDSQDRHRGDRWRLFLAVAEAVDAQRVLYPGSFVDIAPSFVFPAVTYIDSDRRAAAFFADREGVLQIIASHAGGPVSAAVSFVAGDYTTDVGLDHESVDLLVSLYAGFVSEHCTPYLRVGGTLLANPSHGDVALASLDPRYVLSGIVVSRAGEYRVSTQGLDAYLVPKSDKPLTADQIRQHGRGVAYTKSAFAYLFTRSH